MNLSEREDRMKALLFGVAMVMILSSVGLSAPLEAQKMRQEPLEPHKQGLRIHHRQTKQEQRRSWRQKYERDMKRLVERLQRSYPAVK